MCTKGVCSGVLIDAHSQYRQLENLFLHGYACGPVMADVFFEALALLTSI